MTEKLKDTETDKETETGEKELPISVWGILPHNYVHLYRPTNGYIIIRRVFPITL